MPRKKKARQVRFAEPKFSDGVYYAVLIGLVAMLISGVYYKSTKCVTGCVGENIMNGYPYGWFAYNTYEGWQRGNILWVGAVLDIAFWGFIAYLLMLILYAAMKEAR